MAAHQDVHVVHTKNYESLFFELQSMSVAVCLIGQLAITPQEKAENQVLGISLVT